MIDDVKSHGEKGLLNDPNGILSTAGARADLSYCLGLIDSSTHKNAKTIARIRNAFAHSHAPSEVSFINPQIEEECKTLHVLLGDAGSPSASPLNDRDSKLLQSAPRRKFVLATCWTFLVIQLATFTEYFEDSAGETRSRLRKHPTHRTGVPVLAIKRENGKLLLHTNVLLDE
jgi:hypothetical protein